MKFENLEVWKRGKNLSVEIFRFFADSRDWGFKDQIIRSGLSVPSNIAEGFERQTHRECVNFLSYAKGSCGELRTQIHIGIEVGYIDPVTGRTWLQEAEALSLMLGKLIKTKKEFISE